MGIKTGKVATASVEVHLDYQCSKCGYQNHAIDKVTASAGTGTVMGIDTYSEFVSDAQNQLQTKLKHLRHFNAANRYTDVEFSCRCSNCKHREPWARMRYNPLKIIRCVSGCFIFICVMTLSSGSAIPLVLLGIFGLLFALSFVYQAIHIKQMQKQITELPAHAIPRITIQKHGGVIELGPPSVIPPDSWVCCDCGELNSNKQSYCSYCNVSKAWSESKRK